MALINQNSIIGVTSITSPSASNVLTVHTNDTTERLRVSTNGVSFSGTNASLDTSGNATFNGNVSIGGTLTYEDVTNIDSVGVVTARNGLHVTSGNVAIGLNNPSAPLHLSGPAEIRLNNAIDAGNFARIRCFEESGDNGAHLAFNTGAGEVVRFKNNGKVGINSTTPHRQLVVGDGGDISCFGPNGGIYFGTSTGGFRNNGAIARAQQAGYHVSGSQVGDLVMAPEADKDLIISSGSTNTMYERLRLTTGGNIGINDSGPNFHLDVNGNIALREGQVLTWHDGSGNKAGDIYMDSSDNFVIRNTSSVTERLRIDSNGNLGVNKSPETDWASSYRAIEIGNSSVSAYQGSSYPSIELNMNCRGTQASYGAGWKYILGMRATQIHMPYSGETLFRRATSGSADGAISWNESMRISNDGSLYHRGNNSNTINNTDGDGQASAGYPAGGATFNKNISVNDNAGGFGQCMNMISHTKSITLNGSTNHPMVTIFNREGCFIGHVHAGYSTSGDGAVVMYKFHTFYGANYLTAEISPQSRSSDTISVSVDSVGDAHTFRVNGNGYSGDVTIGLVFLSAGVAGGAAHYGVRYY